MPHLSTYVDRGKGFPLLFIHAFPLNHQMWMPQIDFFSPSYRVIAFDLHGFGQAPAVERPRSIDEYAGEVLELLDHLRIERCVVAGLSLGGYIAFALLKKAPAIFHGVVLANTRPTADSDEARANRFRQAVEIRGGGMPAFIDSMMGKLVGQYTRTRRQPVLLALRTLMQQASPEATARMLEAMADRRDSTGFLGTIGQPACIIAGEEDLITPVGEMRLIHEGIHGSEFHIIPQVGHVSNMENPIAFNDIVSSFLRTVT